MNGPRLVEWLEGRRCQLGEGTLGYHARAVRHWREGQGPILAEVDTVLTKLDIHLDELPDDLKPKAKCPGRDRVGAAPGQNCKLTDDQLHLLHRCHVERELSIRELGRRIYAQVGYLSEEAAMNGIRTGWRRLGLKAVRRHPTALATTPRCKASKPNGSQCRSLPMGGTDLCWHHTYPELAVESIARAAAVRRLSPTHGAEG